MSEKITTPQELLKKQQEQENLEWLAYYLAGNPEPVIENLREAGLEIAELETMITSFESAHSLEALHLIIDLDPAEASKHPIREPAKLALIPIVAKLNIFKKETNISTEKHNELKEKYMRISRAVGMINGNKVDHNR